MTSYEREALNIIPGDTPKEKYDYIIGIKIKVTQLREFLDFLSKYTGEIENIRSFIKAQQKILDEIKEGEA